jgi:prevent-host-death family protein
MSRDEAMYSTYEAKARFSEILRRVREGDTILVSYHGRPVAEIRPVTPERDPVAARLRDLERRDVLQRATARGVSLKPVARRPGALQRFLKDRD